MRNHGAFAAIWAACTVAVTGPAQSFSSPQAVGEAPPVNRWVVPQRYADQDDPDGNSGSLGTVMRLQNLYAAALFPSSPMVIREIRYRRDPASSPFPARQLDLRVKLSTSSRRPETLSVLFEENHGPDATVVLDGIVTVASESLAPPGSPPPFDMALPLSTPFTYHPAQGNLLCEIQTREVSGPLWTDATNDQDLGVSRAFALGAEAVEAQFRDTAADVLQFGWSPVTPPDPTNLVVNGSFESPVLTEAPWAWMPPDTNGLTGWTVGGPEGSGVDVVRSVWDPGEGDQSLDLAGWAPGHISQSLATTAGRAYDLSFLIAGNVVEGPQLKTLAVYWDQQYVGTVTFDSQGKSDTNMGWERRSFRNLRAATDATDLRFVCTSAGRAGPALDDVRVAPADGIPPAPDHWVVPPRFATADDLDGSSGVFGSAMRLQNVYAASLFEDGPILIREIRHRRDAGTEPFATHRLDVQLTLSTTAREPDALSSSFQDNLGTDAQVVLDGPITVSSPSPIVPAEPQPFDIVFPLTTPFRFDPAAGNLLYQIRTRSTEGSLWTDASNDQDDNAGRAFSFGEDSAHATFLDTGADIIMLVGDLEHVPLRLRPPSGFFSPPLTVTLTTPLEAAAIHYTTDGTEPTRAAPRYTEPLLLTQSALVQARAFLNDEPASDIVRATYLESVWNDGIPVAWREQYFGPLWFTQAAAAPLADGDADHASTYQEFLGQTDPTNAASVPDPIPALLVLAPPSGTYEGEVLFAPSSPIPASQIRFTRDGTDPAPDAELYPGTPVALLESAALKARVYVNANPVSPVAEASYIVTPVGPSLVSQPAGATVYVGDPVTLQVGAKGTPPLTYQWSHNGVPLEGATGSTLAFAAATLDHAGTYLVQVRNAHGSVTSDPAPLTVLVRPTPPTIVRHPQTQMVAVGGTAVFAVEAVGTEPLRYQWVRSGVALPEFTGPVVTLHNVQKTQAGTYAVRVSNGHGNVLSRPATLTVTDTPVAPQIVAGPLSILKQEGQPAWLAVTATGTVPLHYAWQHNGQPIPDADFSTLAWPAVTFAQAGTYTVTVSNEAGSLTSNPAIVEVWPLTLGGTLVMNNLVAHEVNAPIFDTDGLTPLAGPAFFAQLYAAAPAEPLTAVGPVVPFLTGDSAGYVMRGQGGNAVILPHITPGDTVQAQVRAWEAARGPSFEQAYHAGGRVGQSAILTLATGGGGDPPSAAAALRGLASFSLSRESDPPAIALTSPSPGPTADERFTLSGTITDAIALGPVRWHWNGVDQGPLVLDDRGAFQVAGLRLQPGENRLVIEAADAAGNTASAEVLALWEPARLLQLSAVEPVREGRRFHTGLRLASAGEVSGLTFVVRYDPEQLRDPELAWDPTVLLAGALTQVNLDGAGEVRATVSLPGATLPAGTSPLAALSWRARSVPGPLTTLLEPRFLEAAGVQGTQFEFGNAAAPIEIGILPRLLLGDQNGNGQLDVGDATLIQRLIARLDLPRAWDITLNDLNQSLDLDSGDVVKVLRTVVGLDQARGLQRAGWPAAPRPAGATAASGPALELSASTDLVWPGSRVVVSVHLTRAPASISGLAFSLAYPADLLAFAGDIAYQTGPAVPPGTAAIWNDETGPGRVRFAATGAQAWPAPGGIVAELHFVRSGQPATAPLAVTLEAGELALDQGYEVEPLPVSLLVLEDHVPVLEPRLTHQAEGWELAFPTQTGAWYRLEASTDLETWTVLETYRGNGQVLRVTDPDPAPPAHRFYRLSLVP